MLVIRGGLGQSVRPHVEADDDGIGGAGQGNVGFADGTDCAVDHLDLHFFVGQLGQRLLHRFHGALHVCLDDDRQFLDVAGLDLAEQVVQGQLRLGLFDQLVFAFVDEGSREILRFLVSAHGDKDLACVRYGIQTLDRYRSGWLRVLDPRALVVQHGADFSVAGTCRYKVAYMQGALLNQHRRHRALALVQLRLDHKTSGVPVRIRLQFLHIRREKDILQQILDTFTGLCGDRAADRCTAPVLRDQFVLDQFLLHAVHIGIRLVDLVDCDNDLDTCGLGMIDGFNGLRHDTVVSRHHQHGDIRSQCAAHSHSRERLVARRIQERDQPVVDLHLVGADMLRDAACLPAGDIRLTDRVQKRGLAVVNVAHDAHHRRTGFHLVLVFFGLLQELGDHILRLFLGAQDIVFQRDLLRFLKRDLGVRRIDLTLDKKLLDDLGSILLHGLGEVGNGNGLGDQDLLDLLLFLHDLLFLRHDERMTVHLAALGGLEAVLCSVALVVLIFVILLAGTVAHRLLYQRAVTGALLLVRRSLSVTGPRACRSTGPRALESGAVCSRTASLVASLACSRTSPLVASLACSRTGPLVASLTGPLVASLACSRTGPLVASLACSRTGPLVASLADRLRPCRTYTRCRCRTPGSCLSFRRFHSLFLSLHRFCRGLHFRSRSYFSSCFHFRCCRLCFHSCRLYFRCRRLCCRCRFCFRCRCRFYFHRRLRRCRFRRRFRFYTDLLCILGPENCREFFLFRSSLRCFLVVFLFRCHSYPPRRWFSL